MAAGGFSRKFEAFAPATSCMVHSLSIAGPQDGHGHSPFKFDTLFVNRLQFSFESIVGNAIHFERRKRDDENNA